MASTSTNLRALVVDDIADARTTTARLLTALGCDVETAGDGQSAIEIAAAFHPRLVLIDLAMPFMDGFEVAEHLRWNKPPAFLVAVSGHAEPPTIERCKEAGFDTHVAKPVAPERLAELVAAARAKGLGNGI
jgi:two-component system CheB/CheR fusion protein